jgi:hypothetical protein
MKKMIFLVSAILLLVSCSNSYKVEDVNWILGHWAGLDNNQLTFHERWIRDGKGNFTGTGCTISPEGDTLWKESLKIEVVEGTPYYVADVPGNKGAVLFKLIEASETEAIFENKKHDFPQRITYTLSGTSSLKVQLEGIENGKPRLEKLAFDKLQEAAFPGQ